MKRYKYPRTPHLPWSPGCTNDDRVLADTSCFVGKHIVVTLKMDGENTTLYSDHLHARSVDSKDHPSRHWIKSLWGQKRWLINKGLRVCGENLYARHSISYDDLEAFFLVFSIWVEEACMPYWATRDLCDAMGFVHVPVIYNGFWLTKEDGHDMQEFLTNRFADYPDHEGYVIRNYNDFELKDFGTNVVKYVRANHVQTDTHWMHKPVIPNTLG